MTGRQPVIFDGRSEVLFKAGAFCVLFPGFAGNVIREDSVDFFGIAEGNEVFSVRVFFVFDGLHEQDCVIVPESIPVGDEDDIVFVLAVKPVAEFTFDAGSVFSLQQDCLFFIVHVACLLSPGVPEVSG